MPIDHRTAVRACAIAAIAGLAVPTLAASTFTNQAAFVSNLYPGYSLSTFNALAAFSTPATPMAVASGTFNVTATTTAQAFFIDTASGNNFLSTATATDGFSRPITLSFSGSPVNAVGGNFFVVSAFGQLVAEPVKLTFSDGFETTLSSPINTTFFGYISDVPLTSLTVSPLATHRFVGIDNLHVGGSPIPSSGAGVLALFAGVVASRRRR